MVITGTLYITKLSLLEHCMLPSYTTIGFDNQTSINEPYDEAKIAATTINIVYKLVF